MRHLPGCSVILKLHPSIHLRVYKLQLGSVLLIKPSRLFLPNIRSFVELEWASGCLW